MYIKGGSVVDGNFYIEGGLRVNSIVDAQGNTFISTANATAKALVMFDTDTDSGKIGKLMDSGILKETGANDRIHYTVNSKFGYSELLPLLLASTTYVDDGTAITYYDSSYNRVASKDNRGYRTFTKTEEADSTIFPVAWAYAV